jgi:hypothetical protein
MDEYELSFVTTPINEEVEDLLLERGYFLERHGRLTLVSVDGQGRDGYRVARDEAAKLEELGVRIERLDLDLVTKSQIADRAEVSKQAVQGWTSKATFPKPHTAVNGPLWAWSDVVPWLREVRAYDGPSAPSVRDIDYFNEIWQCEGSLPVPAQVTTWASVWSVRTEERTQTSRAWPLRTFRGATFTDA